MTDGALEFLKRIIPASLIAVLGIIVAIAGVFLMIATIELVVQLAEQLKGALIIAFAIIVPLAVLALCSTLVWMIMYLAVSVGRGE